MSPEIAFGNDAETGRLDFLAQRALLDVMERLADRGALARQGGMIRDQGRNLTNPRFASEIALQLLRSGRGREALGYLNQAAPSTENRHFGQAEWTDAKIAVLDALQRVDEAQTLRLAFFQARLSPSHLRAYLDRLPDFDDVEAEDRALDFVAGHTNVHAALAFLVWWPALERADRLVRLRISDIDGDRYELLDPAAVALEGKYPLAATLLPRALIEETLHKGRATRYKHGEHPARPRIGGPNLVARAEAAQLTADRL